LELGLGLRSNRMEDEVFRLGMWMDLLFARFDGESNRPRWSCFTDLFPKLHRLYTRDCFNNGMGMGPHAKQSREKVRSRQDSRIKVVSR